LVAVLTPKAFANSSPGQRPGKRKPLVNETLKEFANSPGHLMFNHNPFRVAQIHVALPQGSALARATLGWELVNAFGVFCSHRYKSLEPSSRQLQ